MAKNYNTAPFDRKNDEEQIQIFIAYLNILKKNIGTYPPGHSAIDKSKEALSVLIEKIFSNQSTITINAIKNNLLVNGKQHSTKNVHVQGFTLFVSRLGIASLILRNGLEMKELEEFCHLALSIPVKHHIYQHKNILYEMNASSHIQVREIDLAAVRFIDEETVNSTQPRTLITAWQKLMVYCLSPDLQNTWDSDLLKTVKIYDKGSLVSFIQTFNVPENRLVGSYNMVLKDNFQNVSDKDDEQIEKQKFFMSINKAFKDFSPEVKEQLLSATFEVINSSANEKHLEEVLKCMPPDMVIEVLSQAVMNKKIISPVLFKILTMLYKAGRESSELSDKQIELNKTVWDSIKELFSREDYEKYLSEEYGDYLQQLSMGGGGSSKDQPVGFESDEYLKTLQNRSVNRHATSAMMFLMQGNIEEQIYCNCADYIARTIPEMLEAGEYKHLVILHKYLHKHLQANKGPTACNAVKGALKVYSDHYFISKLSEAFESQGNGGHAEIDELVMLTGTVNLSWLIEQYLEQGKAEKVPQTFNLILRFGPQVADIAFKKLENSNDNQKIALLRLIRYCSGKTPATEIPKLLKSNNMEVRLETIKALVKINDPAAMPALWKLICSRDNKVAFKALEIVDDYKVKALAPKLISQIKTFYISKNAFVRNKAILILLANFGYDNLLPRLEKKAGTKFSITPSYLRQTQEFLYSSLTDYSLLAVENLVQKGLKSKNRNIVIICKELIGNTVDTDIQINRSPSGGIQFRGG